MRGTGYSQEDVYLFQDVWKSMMAEDLEYMPLIPSLTHPYSIYIWQPPVSAHGEGHWSEPAQCFTEQWALSIANLMHHDRHALIKVVRYGLNLACFPAAHEVELVEKQIARQRERIEEHEE